MKLVGLMAARNEDWTIGLTARASLMWLDALVILDHASTDRSVSIMHDELRAEYPERVYTMRRDGETWEEMAHRQGMLNAAREIGATHIAYIDADEILSGNLLPYIRYHVESLAVGQMLSLPWLQLRGDVGHVMSSGMWAQSVASVAFRDSPELHWSSAGRGGYDFHQREPMGRSWRQVEPVARHRRTAGLLHLQFLNSRRLHSKQLAYCLTEKLRWPGRKSSKEISDMYGRTVREAASAQVQPVPREWWLPYEHIAHHLHPDAEPWQYQQCVDILRENPGIEDGLDDFGLGLFSSKASEIEVK